MLRVGVYARVSTEEEKQSRAFERQIEELVSYVEKQPNWVLKEVYADKGFTGTDANKRKDYNRMIKDIQNKELDIVVIKDEYRMNRNTFEGLKFLNVIKLNEVKLFFLLERKWYDPKSDLDIKIKLVVAEEQSKHLSKNINDAQRKRQLKGRVITNGTMWGYEQVDGKLVIREDEAEIVRKVFEMYASGKGFRYIMQHLKDTMPQEIKERRGIDTLPLTTIKRMIKNEKYIGIVIGNKKHKKFDKDENGNDIIVENPPEEWIIVKNACPQIISKEIWDKAQEQLNKRKKTVTKDDKVKIAGYFRGTEFISGKLVCGLCGANFWHVKKYSKNIDSAWQCATYKALGKKKGCSAPTVPTDFLRTKLQEVVFKFMKDKDKALKNVLTVLEEALQEPEKNYDELNILKSNLGRLESRKDKLNDAYLDGIMSKEEVLEKKVEIESDVARIEMQIEEIESKTKHIVGRIEKLNMIKKSFEIQFDKPENISDELISEVVEKIEVFSKEKINITLIGNALIEEEKNKFQSVADTF